MNPHQHHIERCPFCGKVPQKWVEPARFNSRQMCWMACKGPDHGIMAGGYTATIAIQNWNREVAIAGMKKGA